MSTVVLVSLILAVGTCHSQTPSSLTCDQLPKLDVTSNEIWVDHSPFKVDFVLTPKFKCATASIVKPARGTTHYDGTVINIIGSSAIVVDYTIGSDRKTIEASMGSNGVKSIWYVSAAQFDNNGGFYCVYNCNKTELRELKCLSNNNGTSPAELQAVDLVRQVPNGHLIYDARVNCSSSTFT